MILRKRLKAIFAFFAAACFLCVCLSCAAILQAGAAETDYAETGIDLLTSPPTAETVYKAGAGTVTYKPAADGAAQIVLQDAELYAGTKVTYSPGNWTYTALAAQGDVELVLQGESTIYLAPSGINKGLLFYDSNLTVKGEGSVWIGYKEETSRNRNAYPMDVLEKSGAETDESGNFTLESGTLTLNAVGSTKRGCLTVNHKIEIRGGELKTNGQMAGVYSTYGDIEITGGKCTIENFNEYGLFARQGDVTIGGDAQVSVSSTARDSGIGICGGNIETEDGNVYIRGGKISVDVLYLGIFTQRMENGGNIEISGGELDINVPSTSKLGVGIYTRGEGGSIAVSGGTVNVSASVTRNTEGEQAVGIYSDGAVTVTGGSVRAGASCGIGEAVGISCQGEFTIDGGEAVFFGDSRALDKAPVVSDNLIVSAASDVQGTQKTEYDPENYGDYKYVAIKVPATVTGVTVTPESASVEVGKTQTFRAEVAGTGEFGTGVVWSVSGANSAGTSIDENGTLTVAADETAQTLTVIAASEFDETKSASATVTVTKTDAGTDGGNTSDEDGNTDDGTTVKAGCSGNMGTGIAVAAVVLAGTAAVFCVTKRGLQRRNK